jgi:hypothetical protein
VPTEAFHRRQRLIHCLGWCIILFDPPITLILRTLGVKWIDPALLPIYVMLIGIACLISSH